MENNITQTHPDYDAVNKSRKIALDLFGGWERVKAAGEGKTYLFQGVNEKLDKYAKRLDRAAFDPFAEVIVEARQGNLFRKAAIRDFAKAAKLAEFETDVDRQGTDASVFFERVACGSQVTGMDWVLVSMPPGPKDEDGNPIRATRANDRESNRRPFFEHLSGEQVTNWGVDESGRLEWAVISRSIRELESDTPWMEKPKVVAEWHVWTRDRWIIYRRTDTDGAATAASEYFIHLEDSHNLGRVPLIPFYGVFDRPFKGWSVFRNVMTQIILIYNQMSDKDWSLALSGHAIPYHTGANQLEVLDAAQGIYIEQKADDPTPQIGYMETNGQAPAALAASIEDLTRRVYAVSLKAMLRNSAQVQSADGQREDRKAFNTSLAVTSISLEESETECWAAFALWLDDKSAEVDVRLSRDFDDKTIEAAFVTAWRGIVESKIVDKETTRQMFIDGEVIPDGITAEEIADRVREEMISDGPAPSIPFDLQAADDAVGQEPEAADTG